MPARHDIDAERELWDTFAESTKDKVFESEPVFCWTQYAGHGPGPELLGNPTTALEIGCGTGRALAYLTQQGVKATGVDLSPVMVKHTSERWGPLGAQFICAEVLDHLSNSTERYDAVYSIFGAAWFTDPAKLFPLIAKRLNPGGVLAFSHPRQFPEHTAHKACTREGSRVRRCSPIATAIRPASGRTYCRVPASKMPTFRSSTRRSPVISEH